MSFSAGSNRKLKRYSVVVDAKKQGNAGAVNVANCRKCLLGLVEATRKNLYNLSNCLPVLLAFYLEI